MDGRDRCREKLSCIHLLADQIVEHALESKQLLICALLDDLTAAKHKDHISILNRRQPVRNHDACLSLG